MVSPRRGSESRRPSLGITPPSIIDDLSPTAMRPVVVGRHHPAVEAARHAAPDLSVRVLRRLLPVHTVLYNLIDKFCGFPLAKGPSNCFPFVEALGVWLHANHVPT